MSSSYRRILIATVILLVFVFGIWAVVIKPLDVRKKEVKKDLDKYTSEIKQIEKIVDKNQSAEETVRNLQDQFERIGSRFPSREEESLRMLAEIARNLNLSVSTLKSSSIATFVGQGGQGISIEGKTGKYVVVDMVISTSYKDLVMYIETIKEQLPAYVTIQSLNLSRSGTELSVQMKVNIYLLV